MGGEQGGPEVRNQRVAVWLLDWKKFTKWAVLCLAVLFVLLAVVGLDSVWTELVVIFIVAVVLVWLLFLWGVFTDALYVRFPKLGRFWRGPANQPSSVEETD